MAGRLNSRRQDDDQEVFLTSSQILSVSRVLLNAVENESSYI